MLMQSSKTKGPYILTCSVFPILKRSLWSFWVIRRLAGCGLEQILLCQITIAKTEFLDFSVQIGTNENGMKPKTIRKWKYRQCENCLLNVSKNAFKPTLAFSGFNEHEDFGRKSHRCEAANFFERRTQSEKCDSICRRV